MNLATADAFELVCMRRLAHACSSVHEYQTPFSQKQHTMEYVREILQSLLTKQSSDVHVSSPGADSSLGLIGAA